MNRLSPRELDMISLRARALSLRERAEELQSYFANVETLFSCREFVDEIRRELDVNLKVMEKVLERLNVSETK